MLFIAKGLKIPEYVSMDSLDLFRMEKVIFIEFLLVLITFFY